MEVNARVSDIDADCRFFCMVIQQINCNGALRTKEDRADAELRQLLGSDISDTESMRTGTWGRARKSGKHSLSKSSHLA